MKKRILILPLLVFIAWGLGSGFIARQVISIKKPYRPLMASTMPDYQKKDAWISRPDFFNPSLWPLNEHKVQSDLKIDVFYIHPTALWIGKTWNYDLKSPGIVLNIIDKSDKIDVEFSATPLNFFMYVISNGSDIYSSRIFINGDIETANKIRQMMHQKEKFREFLVIFLGEKKADIVEDISIKFKNHTKSFSTNFINDINDFLLNDADILAETSEVQKFLDDVDNLKSRTEKLSRKYKK